jgi:cytoskeletal protein CcmA (bactofilin family)
MIKSVWKRILLVAVTIVGIALLSAGVVHAAQLRSDGVIQGPINDDVFVVSKAVSIKGEINGTVIAVGSTIDLDGTINGDVFLVGGKIRITENSKISGNLYLASSDAQIMGTVQGSFASASLSLNISNNAIINRNAYITGYSVEIGANARIDQNLYAAGFQVILNGSIQKNARIAAGAIEIYGRINGDAQFNVSAPGEPTFYLSLIPGVPSAVESGLRVYDGAVISGNLQYISTVNQDSSIHIKNTPIFLTPVPEEPDKQAANSKPAQSTTSTFVMTWLWSFLSRLITFLLLGALVLWLIPAVAESARRQIRSRFFPTAGIGFVAIITGLILVILIPIVFVAVGLLISYLSLGGLNLTWFGVLGALIIFLIVLFFFVLFNGSILMSCYTLGDLLLSKISRENPSRRFLAMLAGVGVFVLLRSAPYIGWILGPLAAILGMGAIWVILLRNFRKKKVTEKK